MAIRAKHQRLVLLVGALVALSAAQPVVSRSEATHGRDGAAMGILFHANNSMLLSNNLNDQRHDATVPRGRT